MVIIWQHEQILSIENIVTKILGKIPQPKEKTYIRGSYLRLCVKMDITEMKKLLHIFLLYFLQF